MKKKKILALFMMSAMIFGSLTACSSNQSETAVSGSVDQGETQSVENTYVYGTLNLNYADYYYGELNQIEAEALETSTTGQYDAEDLVAASGYNDEGMYDAVTSATTVKAKRFTATFTEDTDTGVNIIGPANVNVAISKALYDDVQKAIEDGTECKNKLIEFVEGMTNVTDTAPAEYKVINSDGTISKTIGTTTTPADITATITTTSNWGNYEINLEGLDEEAATVANVQGGIIETSDGSTYGLQHLDNIWANTSEIAFSVKEFTDKKTNVAGFKRYDDMQGKTITKITYLLGNADDIVIETSLYCKEMLAEEYKIEGAETAAYNNTGTKVEATLTIPEDSNYVLSEVSIDHTILEPDTYQFENGIVTLNAEYKPGEYDFVFTDEKYSNLSLTCLIESGLTKDEITFENNLLAVSKNDKDLTLTDYIAAFHNIYVNGTEVEAGHLETPIFNEDGSVNFDATIKSKDVVSNVFTGSESYELSIEADGYPTIEFTVTP